ncbi:hypothetical protein CDD83_3693 [Cordyceps sp. RAO-2017]|nr:hypothetical protein CDD83_3693 [Cordyceps sp. RAO-2017]
MAPFQRLVRFEADDGSILYGDVRDPSLVSAMQGARVPVLAGSFQTGFEPTSRTATIKRVLAPLPVEAVHYFLCLDIPQCPVLFTKPPDALAGHEEAIPIHPEAQSQLDYEAELAVIIGRDGRDIAPERALEHVLGYACANDVSARSFQLPARVSGGQWCFAKSFDGFAPLGPLVASPDVVPDPQALTLAARVNGQPRQRASTADMIWSVRQIIAFASKGTTLRRGTVILTGTPSGVGLFMEPPVFLGTGDEVEVEIQELGILRNTFDFV